MVVVAITSTHETTYDESALIVVESMSKSPSDWYLLVYSQISLAEEIYNERNLLWIR